LGPRRYGKTTLINAVLAQARDDGLVAIKVNFLGVLTLDDIAERIERAYTEQLESKLKQWFTGLVRTLQPTLTGGGGPVPASPATRRFAREQGVDLAEVEPSGPHGRVTRDDVAAAAEEGGEPEPSEEREAARERGRDEAPALPDFERFGPVERVPMRGIRRVTAQRVAVSWREIPPVTPPDVVDVTDLERWRREHRDEVEQAGGTLDIMVLVAKAVAGLLVRYPRFNASIDVEAQEMVLRHHRHLGFAVDTDDGLIVPVVRDVDRRPLTDLAVALSDLIERTRSREVTGEELEGGTFTITNVGPLGGAGFTPLIRHPEVAILGMGEARLQQVVVGDLDDHRTEVRLLLPLSLAYDHRIADGADAARFVGELGDALATPESLLLAV
jgi:pyruvate dehydrogenase E2 component (dihydrolipoamide acetyltransferase)